MRRAVAGASEVETCFEVNALHRVDPMRRESLAFGRGEQLRGTRYVEVYDGGVAVLDIHGPIYRHADSMATSGAMSTGSIAHDFQAAVDSKIVSSIMLVIDSPGGEATAMDELAHRIYDARGVKPVECYAEGLCASAGYYLASACSRITAGRTGMLGSIGVVLGIPAPNGKTKHGDNVHTDGDDIVVEVVSSVSPLKRVNPLEKEGHDYYQAMVDAIADVFVNDVALFRGLDASQVPSQYGDGGVYVGAQALEMGLCDQLGTFDEVLGRLARNDVKKGSSMTGASGKTPSEQGDPEAHSAGEADMKLKDLFKSKPEAGATPPAQGGTEALPIAEVLTHLEGQRPSIEQAVEDAAGNFALRSVLESKVWPAVQAQFAGLMMNAMADDRLYGGVVTFLTLDEKTGTVVEVKGTRAEMVEAIAASMPKHTLSEERVKDVQEGRAVGHVLKEQRREASSVPEPDEDDHGDPSLTAEEVLTSSVAGQAVAREKGNANGNNARK